MCGIWAYLTKKDYIIKDPKLLYKSFNKIQPRGPDNSQFVSLGTNVILGFHRLAIMDTSDNGNQPFYYETDKYSFASICNGEIYNYKELIQKYNIPVNSGSDCEILCYLASIMSPETLCNELDGVFAFIIIRFDKTKNEYNAFIGRDITGVRPLYIGNVFDNNELIGYAFSSELKGLCDLHHITDIKQFKPASYSQFSSNNLELHINEYFSIDNIKSIHHNEDEVILKIRELLTKAVSKRLHADREMGALLSGGLDSSIVCALLMQEGKKMYGDDFKLKTFCIGMEGATDRKYAQMTAEHIGSEHHYFQVTKEEFLKNFEDTVKTTESPDITTNRASTGQYSIGKKLKDKSDCIVVYVGEGADELCQGYLYYLNQPTPEEGDIESREAIKNIHLYDSKRVDRNMSCHGLEVRVPFLDKEFVEYYFSISPELRKPRNKTEKYLLRKTFSGTGLLPEEVIWRRKEAFSDGVSSETDSWHSTLQHRANALVSDELFHKKALFFSKLEPVTKEAFMIRLMFLYYYNKDWFGQFMDTSGLNDDNYLELIVSGLHELNKQLHISERFHDIIPYY